MRQADGSRYHQGYRAFCISGEGINQAVKLYSSELLTMAAAGEAVLAPVLLALVRVNEDLLPF